MLTSKTQTDMLVALQSFAEYTSDLTNAACHIDICTAEECCRCSKIIEARRVVIQALKEGIE